MSNFIPLQKPVINNYEIQAVNKTIKSGWISSAGDKIYQFEKKLKKITNSKYVVSCINGSAALIMAVNLITKKNKGDIIVPTLSFVSSVNSIIHNNCSPFFVDTNQNFNIDEKKLLEFLKNHTYSKRGNIYNQFTKNRIVGIIVTHMWGNICDMKEILKICKIKKIPIIEDAAESLGSYLKINGKTKHAGTFGKIGVLSFNGNKIITTGGGGAILTNDKSIYQEAKLMIDHYKVDNFNYIYSDLGYNFKLNNISASIGISQIKKLKMIIKKKIQIFNFYKKEFNKINGIRMLETSLNCISNFWMFVIIIDNKRRKKSINQIINYLFSKKIETRKVWQLNHLQKPYKKFKKFKISNAIFLQKNSICIPSSISLTKTQLKKVIFLIKKALN